MTPLIVIFITLALAFVITGLLLSAKPHMHNQRPMSTVRTGRRLVVEPVPARTRSMVESERLNARRFSMEIERYQYAGATAAIPLNMGRDFGQRQTGKPIPRSIIIIGLVSIFILGFYLLNILLPHPALSNLVTFYVNASAAPPPSQNQNPPQYNASQSLVRLSQLDPGQYASAQEYTTWAYSACSAAAMTEVFNAYGHHYRVTDILKVEAQIGEITPQLGLLEEVGIQRTAAQFGFNTTWGHSLSLDQIIDIANHGRPVIVSFPPDRYAGGHLLVVTGGNSSTVYLADSSRWNRHSLSRAQFLQWWEGFSAIVTPK